MTESETLIWELRKELHDARMDTCLAEQTTRRMKRDLHDLQGNLKWAIDDLRMQIENVQYFIETIECEDDLAKARNLTKVLLSSLDRHGRRISNFAEDCDV